MKILLTGSNGLLGQKLIALLHKNKIVELVATSKGQNRCGILQGYTYYSCDISKKKSIEEIVNYETPHVIINTAAMTNVDMCENDKEGCDMVNIKAVQNLVDICIAREIFLVHLSTDFIFDGLDSPYDEKAIPNSLSYYGSSKLKAEKIIYTSTTAKVSILRTALVYGMVNDMSRSNIVLWAKESLQNRKQIKVVDDQFRCPTLAEDLAMGCFLSAKKQIPGVFNITGKDFMCIYDMVEHIADFWNLDKSLISKTSSEALNQPAKRPYKTNMLIGKAVKELGYNPHSFQEGLKMIDKQLKSLL